MPTSSERREEYLGPNKGYTVTETTTKVTGDTTEKREVVSHLEKGAIFHPETVISDTKTTTKNKP